MLALGLACAGCLDSGNIPGVTTDPEAAAKAAFPELPPAAEATQLKDRGSKMFNGLGCQSCHSTTHERNGLMGPPLGGVSDRVLERKDHDPLKARRWLVMHIKDPLMYPSPFADQADYKGTHMPPNPRVTDEDLRALVEFLWALR
ncbi:MAG: cytochrome c [Planctomycetes bacterium]|nr:cytochrome c [Planctomycetota bacterium]